MYVQANQFYRGNSHNNMSQRQPIRLSICCKELQYDMPLMLLLLAHAQHISLYALPVSLTSTIDESDQDHVVNKSHLHHKSSEHPHLHNSFP